MLRYSTAAVLLILTQFIPSPALPTEQAPGSVPEVTLRQTAHIGGRDFPYVATNGSLRVRDGSAAADLSYTAFVGTTGLPSALRPITFAFNGGPGASVMWLQVGALGPRRVDLGPSGIEPPQPTRLVENENFPIDATDLVLVDTVGAGLSRAAPGTPPERFFNLPADATILRLFVRDYLRRNDRIGSPVYLLGESYGGVRASLVADQLQVVDRKPVAGIFLISPAFQTMGFDPVRDPSVFWKIFPSFAATAWFHRVSAPDRLALPLPEVFARARAFAETRLRRALEAGPALPPSELAAVAAEASAWTGLPQAVLAQAKLRLTNEAFAENVLRPRGAYVAIHDARGAGALPPGPGPAPEPHPLVRFVTKVFYEGMLLQLRELGASRAREYLPRVNGDTWTTGDPARDARDAILDLSHAMALNPGLRVAVAGGFYDLVCPVDAVEHELRRLPAAGRLRTFHFPTGHMVYLGDASGRFALKEAFRGLVQGR